jgi:hypothetical protein
VNIARDVTVVAMTVLRSIYLRLQLAGIGIIRITILFEFEEDKTIHPTRSR